jgi:hypothetical protein
MMMAARIPLIILSLFTFVSVVLDFVFKDCVSAVNNTPTFTPLPTDSGIAFIPECTEEGALTGIKLE